MINRHWMLHRNFRYIAHRRLGGARHGFELGAETLLGANLPEVGEAVAELAAA